MAFGSIMDGIVETAEEERARLAQAPAGSTSHGLSQAPVNIKGKVDGLLIKLPKLPYADGTLPEHDIVVVPSRYHSDSKPDVEKGEKYRRNPGYWDCIVVYSTDPRYPVGGYGVVVGADELVRGEVVSLDQVLNPDTPEAQKPKTPSAGIYERHPELKPGGPSTAPSTNDQNLERP